MNWRAMIAGALGLVVVQRLTSTGNSAGAVAGIGGALSAAVRRFLDPTAPLWSDAVIAKATGSAGAGAGTGQPARSSALPPKGTSNFDRLFGVGIGGTSGQGGNLGIKIPLP